VIDQEIAANNTNQKLFASFAAGFGFG